MTGEVIKRKLPKYKLEAMAVIADECFKELSPKVNHVFSKRDFGSATYKFEGSYLTIFLIGGALRVYLAGDFPRLELSGSNSLLISYDVAKKIKSKHYELIKNTSISVGFENELFTEFNFDSESLRVVGRLGTRVIFSGR